MIEKTIAALNIIGQLYNFYKLRAECFRRSTSIHCNKLSVAICSYAHGLTKKRSNGHAHATTYGRAKMKLDVRTLEYSYGLIQFQTLGILYL